MTKKQKKAKAARSRKKTAIGRAAHTILRHLNPGRMKNVRAMRFTRLKGGGFSVHPVKAVKAVKR